MLRPFTNPYVVCKRLIDFAARMHEVQSPDAAEEMVGALSEMHHNVIRLVTGRSVDLLPASTPVAHVTGMVTALVKYGHANDRDGREALASLNASIDELFRAVDLCRDERKVV